jgi:hypothetical protein
VIILRKEFNRLKVNIYKQEYISLSFDAARFKNRDYYVGIASILYKRDINSLLVYFEENIKTQEEIAKTIANVVEKVREYSFIINIIEQTLEYAEKFQFYLIVFIF